MHMCENKHTPSRWVNMYHDNIKPRAILQDVKDSRPINGNLDAYLTIIRRRASIISKPETSKYDDNM